MCLDSEYANIDRFMNIFVTSVREGILTRIFNVRCPHNGAIRLAKWFLIALLFSASPPCLFAQPFKISAAALSNGVVSVKMPSRADSYYILQGKSKLSGSSSFTPTNFLLGNGGNIIFTQPLVKTGSMFITALQVPLTSTNSFQNDGIPDGWKLQHGLNPFSSGITNQYAPGYVSTWQQVYQQQTNLAALPAAYFPSPSSTVLIGSSNAIVSVAFTKPYTGTLTYQLSGTAIPSSSGVTGDYLAPIGSVSVFNSTSATIIIRLVPESGVEINRSIVLAITAPPAGNQTYTIFTNSSITTVLLAQSTLGVYLGSLAMSNGIYAGAQSVKMALKPGSGTNNVAFFDITGNALLGSTFTVPVSASATNFQLNGAQYNNILTNTPWGRPLNVSLSFGATQTADGTTFLTPVTVSLAGLTASGSSYSGTGFLTVSRVQ